MTIQIQEWDGKPITADGAYSSVPMGKYHGPGLCDGPSISSSGLRTIFCQSPMSYWIEAAINPNRVEPADKEAFVLGRATHHLLLGEADFGKHFVVQPDEIGGKPWQPNRTECRLWKGEQQAAGLTVLKPAQIEQIRGMAGLLPWQTGLHDSGLKNTQIVMESGLLSGAIEQSIVFRDKETGYWLKSRPDAIPAADGIFSDLKTTTSVDRRAIAKTIAERRYDMQAALIGRASREVLGVEMTAFLLVFVEKTPPYGVQVVELKPADIDEAEKDLRTAMRMFARCLDTKRWPGPGGTQSDAMFIEMPAWARKAADDRRTFLEQEIKAA